MNVFIYRRVEQAILQTAVFVPSGVKSGTPAGDCRLAPLWFPAVQLVISYPDLLYVRSSYARPVLDVVWIGEAES